MGHCERRAVFGTLPRMRVHSIGLVFLLVGFALPAAARNPDGTLGLLVTPNDGMPALVATGETAFEAVATAEAALVLDTDAGPIPVEVVWTPAPGGRFRGQCGLPEGLGTGLYTLRATVDGVEDANARAVAIVPPPGDVYAIAHVSDTHIGSGRHARSSNDIIRDVFSAVNESGAALCLITGDLTENGEAPQFQDFLAVLDRCTVPTFVCPGNHDRKGTNYTQFFGPMVYWFHFGRDGYLSFDTKDFVTAPDTGEQPGQLEIGRRAIKPSRWSIGFSHRFEGSQGMRSQLSLFVDNPLDYLLFGHWHRENTAEERAVPWGKTRISVVPAAIDGTFRVIDVTPQGLHIRPFETPAAIE